MIQRRKSIPASSRIQPNRSSWIVGKRPASQHWADLQMELAREANASKRPPSQAASERIDPKLSLGLPYADSGRTEPTPRQAKPVELREIDAKQDQRTSPVASVRWFLSCSSPLSRRETAGPWISVKQLRVESGGNSHEAHRLRAGATAAVGTRNLQKVPMPKFTGPRGRGARTVHRHGARRPQINTRVAIRRETQPVQGKESGKLPLLGD